MYALSSKKLSSFARRGWGWFKIRYCESLKTIFPLLLASLFACQNNQNSEVKILPPVQMAKVLSEIHLAESQVPHFTQSPDSAQKLYKAFEKKVFDKVGIDSAIYYQSYQYYINRVEEFEKIYAIVIDSLVYRESKMDIGKAVDSAKQQKIAPKNLPTDSSGLKLRKKIKIIQRKELKKES